MSRRELSQPSFVDAMVSGYGLVGGFLDRIERGSTGRRLRRCFRRSTARRWERRLSAFDDVQDPASAAMAHAL
jgi:hypothetical protein